jgi:hypothetical protein
VRVIASEGQFVFGVYRRPWERATCRVRCVRDSMHPEALKRLCVLSAAKPVRYYQLLVERLHIAFA